MEKNNTKPKILITFRQGGENGGPYISHKRIMESGLKEQFEFIPLFLPVPKKILTPKGIIKLKRHIQKEKPDILHFAGLQLEGFAVLLAAKIAGVKNTICAIHGSSADAVYFKGYKKKIMIRLENWTLKHSLMTYGVSNFVANWDRVKKYAKNNQGCIYNMRSVEKINADSRKNMRDEFGFKEDEIVVVSTGRIVKDKGFEVLLQVIEKAVSLQNVKYLIVGEGSYRLEMEEQIKRKGLSGNVIFTGYRKDIMYLLSGCDIFMICTFHETLCNSVIEASDAGLPVVATRTGGIPEIVKDGVTGYLIESNDVNGFKNRLENLVVNRELRLKMGQAGKELIGELFSEEVIAEKLRFLYNELLKIS